PPQGFSGNLFLTPEVLGFLAQQGRSGVDRIPGFWRIEEIISDLGSMGFEEEEIRHTAQRALAKKLIAYEGENTSRLTDSDLVKITPKGVIHLRALPHFIEYISSVALHSAIGDEAGRRRIADIWSRAVRMRDLSFSAKHEVASIYANYLVREKR